MAVGVDLGKAGVPDCDALIEGDTPEDVMAKVRQHLATDHADVPITETLMSAIQGAIAPIKKD